MTALKTTHLHAQLLNLCMLLWRYSLPGLTYRSACECRLRGSAKLCHNMSNIVLLEKIHLINADMQAGSLFSQMRHVACCCNQCLCTASGCDHSCGLYLSDSTVISQRDHSHRRIRLVQQCSHTYLHSCFLQFGLFFMYSPYHFYMCSSLFFMYSSFRFCDLYCHLLSFTFSVHAAMHGIIAHWCNSAFFHSFCHALVHAFIRSLTTKNTHSWSMFWLRWHSPWKAASQVGSSMRSRPVTSECVRREAVFWASFRRVAGHLVSSSKRKVKHWRAPHTADKTWFMLDAPANFGLCKDVGGAFRHVRASDGSGCWELSCLSPVGLEDVCLHSTNAEGTHGRRATRCCYQNVSGQSWI